MSPHTMKFTLSYDITHQKIVRRIAHKGNQTETGKVVGRETHLNPNFAAMIGAKTAPIAKNT
jgi:hypothetical protein